MVNLRTFCLSCDMFSSFKTQIDLDDVDNISQIIKQVIDKLNQILITNNLTLLSNKLLKIEYHVHDYTFVDILLSDNDKIFYICNHEHYDDPRNGKV